MKNNIKKIPLTLLIVTTLSNGLMACKDDGASITQEDLFNLSVSMKQTVNGMPLSLNTPDMPYSNKRGQPFNVSKLKYLISNIRFIRTDGSVFSVEGYHLVDAADRASLIFKPVTKVPGGEYAAVLFTLGFNEKNNIDGAYADLNTASWNWPSMLGGGYHNLQLEGRYKSSGISKPFTTHMGAVRDNSVSPEKFLNNSVEIRLDNLSIQVKEDFSLELLMKVEQWYQGPFEWDFNVWNAGIMPVFDAQIKLKENALTVFSIKAY